MGRLANSEDPNEMPHFAVFHQSLYALLRYNRKEDNTFGEIIVYGPSVYIMDHPGFIL